MVDIEDESLIYCVTLVCSGVPPELGLQGAIDVTEEFTHRPWHQNVRCDWDGSSLVLYAENDYDEEGKAPMGEFSDAISACVERGFDGDISVQSITTKREQSELSGE